MSQAVFWVALLVLLYALAAQYLEHSIITAPMMMLVAGAILGTSGLGLVVPSPEGAGKEALAELALTLTLFNAGAQLHFRHGERHWAPPLRLIAIALPLSILAATVMGVALFPALPLSEALLLASVLAPGDEEVARPFMDDPDVPRLVTDTLNLENAFNDALVVTFFTLAMSVTGGAAFHPRGQWIAFLARQLGLGLVMGGAIGLGGAKLLDWHVRHGRFTPEGRQLAILALAIVTYGAAARANASPFVAVSAAGLALGNYSRTSVGEVFAFSRSMGLLMTELAYALIGAVAVGPALSHLSWRSLAYAGLMLTVVRMGPVALSLLGMRLGRAAVASIGWFSPRGLPSALLGLLFVQKSPGESTHALTEIMTLTVLLSIFVHGASAYPAARAWERWQGRAGRSVPDAAPPR